MHIRNLIFDLDIPNQFISMKMQIKAVGSLVNP